MAVDDACRAGENAVAVLLEVRLHAVFAVAEGRDGFLGIVDVDKKGAVEVGQRCSVGSCHASGNLAYLQGGEHRRIFRVDVGSSHLVDGDKIVGDCQMQGRIAHEHVAQPVAVGATYAVRREDVVLCPAVDFACGEEATVFVAAGQSASHCLREKPVVGYVHRAGGADNAYRTAIALEVDDLGTADLACVEAQEVAGGGVDEGPVAQKHVVEVGVGELSLAGPACFVGVAYEVPPHYALIKVAIHAVAGLGVFSSYFLEGVHIDLADEVLLAFGGGDTIDDVLCLVEVGSVVLVVGKEHEAVFPRSAAQSGHVVGNLVDSVADVGGRCGRDATHGN